TRSWVDPGASRARPNNDCWGRAALDLRTHQLPNSSSNRVLGRFLPASQVLPHGDQSSFFSATTRLGAGSFGFSALSASSSLVPSALATTSLPASQISCPSLV